MLPDIQLKLARRPHDELMLTAERSSAVADLEWPGTVLLADRVRARQGLGSPHRSQAR
jgi:hypothetical protein